MSSVCGFQEETHITEEMYLDGIKYQGRVNCAVSEECDVITEIKQSGCTINNTFQYNIRKRDTQCTK